MEKAQTGPVLVAIRDQQVNSEPAGENGSISPNRCNDCGIEYHWETIGEGRYSQRLQCPTCECERKNIEAAEAAEKRNDFEKRINDQIPPRFRQCRLGDFRPRNPKQVDAHRVIAGDLKGSYLLIGPYANGKTHLLYAQFRARFESGVKCYARTTDELLHEMQQEDVHEVTSPIRECIRDKRYFHLFWDDADKFKVTDWKSEALFSLIDGIYRNEQSLTVTSNLNLLELQEKLSPAICRRIDDICKKIEL